MGLSIAARPLRRRLFDVPKRRKMGFFKSVKDSVFAE
jgi:hypothetical protein